MDRLTDDELINEIQHGSKAAMEILVRRHYKMLYSYCLRHIGNSATAEDLTHDTFLKMMQSIVSYNPRGTFRNWLMTICVHICRNYLTAAYYRHEGSVVELETFTLPGEDSPEEQAERNEEKHQIAHYLRILPEPQREAILLRFFDDMKLTDIAEVTDVSLQTVKYRIRQATKKLKEWMEVDNDENRLRPYIRIVK
jgi:RNA polymerase sigma-70 factor (ECF subfamily)